MRLADIQNAIRQGRILAGPHAANGAGADLLTLNEVWTAILGAAGRSSRIIPTILAGRVA
jgi:hypothetical protein